MGIIGRCVMRPLKTIALISGTLFVPYGILAPIRADGEVK